MKRIATGLAMLLAVASVNADQVFPDDIIGQGSLCVGFDCVNGEVFDFDTLRLKENNTRIRFDDTSSSSTFPRTDWQLTANDSNNGGRNRFSVEDVSAGSEIFTLMGAAPAFSLFVGETGDLGLGTDQPAQRLHLVGQNTPTVRIEQSGSGGFQPATWDISANAGELRIALNGTRRLELDASGNLTVTGGVTTTGITESQVPDYVFGEGYRLMPLDQLESFVGSKRHLPDVPSAGTIARDGMNITDLQLRLLRKVEELTLYTLQQQREIEQLRDQLNANRGQ